MKLFSKHKNMPVLLVGLVASLLVGLALYVKATGPTNGPGQDVASKSSSKANETEEEKKDENDAKPTSPAPSNAPAPSPSTPPENKPQSESNSKPTSTTLSISINSTNNQTVTANANKVVSGDCTFTFSRPNFVNYIQTAPLQDTNRGYSGCSYLVKKNELATGPWSVRVTISDNTGMAPPATGTIDITNN